MKKSIISVVLLVLLFLGSVETFAQKQIVRRVPNEPVVPQKQAQSTKTPTHHAPKKKRRYDCLDEYSEGLARVCNDYDWGFIDKSGTLVIPFKYTNARSFHEGLAAVSLPNGRYGFIDKSGTEIIPCKYGNARDFSEGLAPIGLFGKWGFIDKSGTEIIPCKYEDADSFSEGLANVCLNYKWGFIDKSGTEIIPCKYDWAFSFSEGQLRFVSMINGALSINRVPL